MFTYQVRRRYYKLTNSSQQLIFPNVYEALFLLQPLQPFGKSATGGRTAVQGAPCSVFFNANSGHHFTESKAPLQPLEVTVEEPTRTIELRGNELKIRGQVESLRELDDTLYSILFVLPILLNIEFADPAVVERVEGKVGDCPFRWELEDWRMDCYITTLDKQEEAVVTAWNRFNVLSKPSNRRLVAALHYFHVFCRLCRAGHSPWEFMAEAIVNLSKILEVLFPPTGDGQSLDAARAGLRALGYSSADCERLFVPAIVLRNNIDSAHVDLSLFTMSQLHVLHSYTEIAERAFRQLLSRILGEIESGRYEVAQHGDSSCDPRTANIIQRLEAHLSGVNVGGGN
jgi:hypothetical protein